jgi:hypothetical protein
MLLDFGPSSHYRLILLKFLYKRQDLVNRQGTLNLPRQ